MKASLFQIQSRVFPYQNRQMMRQEVVCHERINRESAPSATSTQLPSNLPTYLMQYSSSSFCSTYCTTLSSTISQPSPWRRLVTRLLLSVLSASFLSALMRHQRILLCISICIPLSFLFCLFCVSISFDTDLVPISFWWW